MEHCLGKDGQKRDGPAKEHGKEVERDCAKQDRGAADEMDAREECTQMRGVAHDGIGGRVHAHQRHARQGDQEQAEGGAVGDLRVDRKQRAANRRAHDHRRLIDH